MRKFNQFILEKEDDEEQLEQQTEETTDVTEPTEENNDETDVEPVIEVEPKKVALVVELDDNSKAVLLELAKRFVKTTNGFDKAKYYCDHFDVYHKWEGSAEKYYERHKDEKVSFTVTHIGVSEKVIAVKVSTEIKSSRKNKYIVLAISKQGKCGDADEFTTWDRIGFGTELSGKLKIKTKKIK